MKNLAILVVAFGAAISVAAPLYNCKVVKSLTSNQYYIVGTPTKAGGGPEHKAPGDFATHGDALMALNTMLQTKACLK